MKLKLYLAENRITIKEFCEQIGYSRNQISGIVNEKLRPSKRLAKVIEDATNGKVKSKDLLKEDHR